MKIKVVLFCGGRGSKTIISELLKRQNVELTLIVNAYDDGLSTGALRKLIPGMLGPSDFRKNSTYLLSLHSEEQYAIQQLVEYRFDMDTDFEEILNIKNYLENGIVFDNPVCNLLEKIGFEPRKLIIRYVLIFFEYLGNELSAINFADYSFGNLLFAGLYLSSDKNFNKAIDGLISLLKVDAKIYNVSDGEALTLVALKNNGEILTRESSVVGVQSSDPIFMTYLIKGSDINVLDDVKSKNFEDKRKLLEKIERKTTVSNEASSALGSADIIIYGPGTQHSSLLPSYKISSEFIKSSRSIVKIMVANINYDNDIQCLTVKDLIDNSLKYLADVNNYNQTITHVLYDSGSIIPIGFDSEFNVKKYKNIEFISSKFISNQQNEKHSGYLVVQKVLDIHRKIAFKNSKLKIILDLRGYEASAHKTIEAIYDLPIGDFFSDYNVLIVASKRVNFKLHNNKFKIILDRGINLASVVLDWMRNSDEEYLFTLKGDGDYSMGQIIDVLNVSLNFQAALVLGSRTQSRAQFLKSLSNNYREKSIAYYLSKFGAYVISMIYMIRFGRFIIDPLSGFQLYSRDIIRENFKKNLDSIKYISPHCLIKEGLEIMEYPVFYKTNIGFANYAGRIQKGFIALLVAIFI